MTTGQALVPLKQTREIMQAVTAKQVQALFCPQATTTEAELFIRFCLYQDLNPFLREAFLIKYQDGEPAAMVVAKDGKLKRANSMPPFSGFHAGIIVLNAD